MRMLKTLAVGLIGYGVYSTLQQRHRQARVATAKPEPLQRWEDEGGNVPAANPALQETVATPTPLRPERAPG